MALGWAMTLPQGQKTMGEQHQGQVAMQSPPETALIVIQAQFAFGVLVEALYDPAHVQQAGLLFQVEFIETPDEVPPKGVEIG